MSTRFLVVRWDADRQRQVAVNHDQTTVDDLDHAELMDDTAARELAREVDGRIMSEDELLG